MHRDRWYLRIGIVGIHAWRLQIVRHELSFYLCITKIVPSFVQKKFVVLLPDLAGIEQPPCPNPLSGGGLDGPDVLPDTDIIPDSIVIEPSDPFLADELPVSRKAVDIVLPEKMDEPLHNSLAFFPIGVDELVQKTEQQGECEAFISDAESENHI